MKVQDLDIINAVWNEQLKQMCNGFIDHYADGSYGLSSVSLCEEYNIHIGSTQRANLNLCLSHSYLLKKLKKLVQCGKLHAHREYASGSFYYGVNRDKQFDDAIKMIRDYWSNLGLGDRHNTVKLNDFCNRLSIIQDAVLNKYGKLTIGIK